MTTRFAAVLSTPSAPATAPAGGVAPPGVDPDEFRLAMLEDVYEVAAGLEFVEAALVLDPPRQPDAEGIIWPGTAIVREATLTGMFAALHRLGAGEAVLLIQDAPDLPPLLLGKLFRALGNAPAAVCPVAHNGGLIALAARLPLPAWLATCLDTAPAEVFDRPDALKALRAAAPRPGLVQQGPGWHRLRTPADIGLLDPGLEGWDNTRALLEGHTLP